MSSPIQDLYPREVRMLRAVNDVLQRYSIREEKKSKSGERCFQVDGGTRPYRVIVSLDWSNPPQCSCPDFAGRASRNNRGYCKHIIAVLFLHDDLKCQLIELFL